MNRRGFLASLLGLATAPIAGTFPAPPAPLADWSPLQRRGDVWMSAKAWNDKWLARYGAMKYWYDKPTRTIKFRRYTPWEIYKSPGTYS